jgi:osmoprotectant transport system permease protein
MLLSQILNVLSDPNFPLGTESMRTVEYTLIPLMLCVLIAVPLGVLVAPSPAAAFLAANISGAARAIPTIAFLAAMISVPSALGGGIGFRPAVVALTLLGIPPILLNTVAGLRSVDPAALEAARGMGMTRWQVLARVQIPLVLPVIAAGVRTSGVQIAATTPLAALIGGQGFGDYIFTGLGIAISVGLPYLLVGAGGVAILALLTEVGLGAVQRAVTPAGLRVRDIAEAPEADGERPTQPGGELAAA